jgi:hypothetical protein
MQGLPPFFISITDTAQDHGAWSAVFLTYSPGVAIVAMVSVIKRISAIAEAG